MFSLSVSVRINGAPARPPVTKPRISSCSSCSSPRSRFISARRAAAPPLTARRRRRRRRRDVSPMYPSAGHVAESSAGRRGWAAACERVDVGGARAVYTLTTHASLSVCHVTGLPQTLDDCVVHGALIRC